MSNVIDIGTLMQQNIQTFVLTSQFQEIFRIISTTNSNILIDGGAGTGKSTLLINICNNLKKKYIVLAPTGIAAVHVGGITIHSFFGLPITPINKDCTGLNTNRNYDYIRTLDTIIIDEISMVRADVFNAIDFLLRKHRKNNSPFGGVQMVLFGDIFQLPPVITSIKLRNMFYNDYKSEFFFSTSCFTNGQFLFYELNTIFRQSDRLFQDLLNRVRKGIHYNNDIQILNNRVIGGRYEKPYYNFVYVSSTNKDVNQYNHYCLDKIQNKKYAYIADKYGDINPNTYNIDEVLELKVGSQVMMTRNDAEGRWINGTFGIVSKLSEDEIFVKINNIDYKVEKQQWDIYECKFKDNSSFQNNLIARISQYPLTLAWALTIHKCQGQTINNLVVNLGNRSFPGQVYVALSRCTSLDYLFLENPITSSHIKADLSVIEFYNKYFTNG